jgi:hypothetical protein
LTFHLFFSILNYFVVDSIFSVDSQSQPCDMECRLNARQENQTMWTPEKQLEVAERELAEALTRPLYDTGWVVECRQRVRWAKERIEQERRR